MRIRNENIGAKDAAKRRRASQLKTYSEEREYRSSHEHAFWVPQMDFAHILIYTVVCLLSLIPWIIIFYPGIMEIDTVFQIAEFRGYGYGYGAEEGTFTNLYPLLDVWVFGAVSDALATMFGGDQRAAVAGLCLLVAVLTSLSASTCACYLQKWNLPIAARFVPIVAFMAIPAFSLMRIDIGKDTLFCAAFIPFSICCCEMLRTAFKGEEYSAGWIAALVICGLLASLTASKGIILVCAPLLVAVIYSLAKKSRNVIGGTAALSSIVIVFASFSLLVVPMFVDSGESTTFRELLGTPVQQVSFAVKTGTKLTDKEEEQLKAFFNLDAAVKRYDPAISDHTKNYVKLDAGLPEVMGFLDAYISISTRAGDAYWQAFSDLYDGYYEVGTYNALLLPRFMPTWQAFEEYGWTSQDNLPNSMAIMKHALENDYLIYSFTNLPEYQEDHPDYASWGMYTDGEETRIAAFEYMMNWGTIPILCLLVDKSLYVLYLPLLMFGCALIFGGRKRFVLSLSLIPLLLSSLIAFASPIDFSRYVYPCLMLCLFLSPIVFGNMSIRRDR